MDQTVSIVIPTRNAADALPRALAALAERPLVREILVVDGGSTDRTVVLARAAGATVIDAPMGRGCQLAHGAEAASGDWLLFVHADTVLDPGWDRAVAGHLGRSENVHRAGYFQFALDDQSRAARGLERMVAVRARLLGLPYGDQGLLISRALYDAIGGFRPLVLMEDVDLVRRIGRRRLVMLDCRAVTCAARYRRSGYLSRSTRNLVCLSLYFLGLSPRLIARLYG